MKKIIFSLIIPATILLIFSCKKEPIAPLEVADYFVVFSNQGTNSAGNVAINDYLSFIDISQNAVDHEWRIGDGGVFISDKFTDADSVYSSFILPDAGSVSTEKKVNILFVEKGLQTVQIVNTFDKEPATGPVTARQEGGLWVIDTTYIIDVYADVMPAFKVFQDDVEIANVAAGDIPDLNNSATWPEVEIEAGQSLTFVDMTTVGRSNKRSWNLPGADSEMSNDSVATVSYFTIGEFLGGTFTALRDGERPEQEANRVIPIRIKVLASSEPLLFEGNLIEQADERITFSVGGELKDFSGLEGDFTVNVVNDSASFNQNIDVALAKVSDADATQIELTLAEPIFNSDVITITYTGSGIESADARTLATFGPESVSMYFEESLLPADWASFETASGNWKAAFCEGFWVGNSNGDENVQFYARTEEMAASGLASMKLDLMNGVENKTLQGSNFGDFGLTAGTYLIKFKVYLETGNVLTTLQTFVKEPATPINWDVTNTPRGEWVEFSQIVSFDAAPTDRYDFKVLADLNPETTDQQVLYLDDYEFIVYEVR